MRGIYVHDGNCRCGERGKGLDWWRQRRGQAYENGLERDYGQARIWYEKAATQGNSDAQYQLGMLYDEGRGVPKDHAQALSWYEKAAGQGHSLATFAKLMLQTRIPR